MLDTRRVLQRMLIMLLWVGWACCAPPLLQASDCDCRQVGTVNACQQCGRTWIVSESPFVLHSEQATIITRVRTSSPNEANYKQPSTANPTFDHSQWQPIQHQFLQSPPTVSSFADTATNQFPPQRLPFDLGPPPQTTSINPETWLSESTFGSAPSMGQESGWYESITAEPDDVTCELSFRSDLSNAWTRFKSDFTGVLQPNNLLVLTAAAGGAIAIHQDLDDEVRQSTLEHRQRWADGSHVLNFFGEATVQIPALTALYLWSLKSQNDEMHDVVTTTMSAYSINGISTMMLKFATNTRRPSDNYSNGNYGFPSFHTSSTFTIASVMNEYYGWQVGVPAYALAGLVGWSRIDNRDHDLSDVVFGAALGYVIGTSVARHHLTGDSRVILLPWNEPTNRAVGLACEWRF